MAVSPGFVLEALARLEPALAKALEQPVLLRIGLLGAAADTDDSEQLQAAEGLRALMETVYGQAITSK